MDRRAVLSGNFNQQVYNLIEPYKEEVRYNPKISWDGEEITADNEESRPVFQVAELQQMTDPLEFISRTADQYPDLDLEMVRDAFTEVLAEVARKEEEEQAKAKRGKKATGTTEPSETI